MSDLLTIMVPTMNRSDFVIRLLNYYAQQNYKHWISIGDSSDAFHVGQTRKAIEKLKGKLKVIYNEYPGLSDSACIQRLVQTAATPYAVFLADDDFLVPASLEKCLAFLEEHPDHSAAHGVAVQFFLEKEGPLGKMLWVNPYLLPSLEQATASERLYHHLTNISTTLFSVQKTETWKKIYENINLPDRAFSSEHLPTCLSVILGKVAQLDCLYLFRQEHSRRYTLPDFYDWLTSRSFGQAYQIFKETLVENLVQQDGISVEAAGRVIKAGIYEFMYQHLDREYRSRPKHKALAEKIVDLKTAAKSKSVVAAYVLPLWRRARIFRQRLFPAKNNLLNSLLASGSKYHEDFMGVHQLMAREEGSL